MTTNDIYCTKKEVIRQTSLYTCATSQFKLVFFSVYLRFYDRQRRTDLEMNFNIAIAKTWLSLEQRLSSKYWIRILPNLVFFDSYRDKPVQIKDSLLRVYCFNTFKTKSNELETGHSGSNKIPVFYYRQIIRTLLVWTAWLILTRKSLMKKVIF